MRRLARPALASLVRPALAILGCALALAIARLACGAAWSELAGSLRLEALLLLAAAAGSQLGWPAGIAARLLVFALLASELAATFFLRASGTYLHGFQLDQLHGAELRNILAANLLPLALSLGAGVGAALLFPMRPMQPGALGRAAIFSAPALLLALHPGWTTLRPMRGQSPLVYLALTRDAALLAQIPPGTAHPEDWAPVTQLESRWSALGAAPRDFNVIVVMLESVRAMSVWPAPAAPPMPFLESLAPRSVRFTRAYAAYPRSSKTLDSLVFGIYPQADWPPTSTAFPDLALETLFQRLRARGQRTAFLTNADLAFEDNRRLVGHGQVDVARDQVDLRALDPTDSDRALLTELDQFLEQDRARPFSAVLWTRQTHYPYKLPVASLNRFPPRSREAYLDAIAFTDGTLRELFALLDRRGLTGRTVVILAGDHGESLGEHSDNGAGHGVSAYEETTHVPLWLVNAQLFHGETDDRLVQLQDLAPTIAWLAGDPRPNLNAGRCLFYARATNVAYLENYFGAARGGVIVGQEKYIYERHYGQQDSKERVFDLAADPEEKRPLAPASMPALRDRYFGWLHHWDEKWKRIAGRSGDAAFVQRVFAEP